MVSRWRRRLDQIPDSAPVLPYVPYQLSNGEFVPRGPNAAERCAERAILAACDEAARRRGVARREFLTSAGAMAATFSVLNACASSGDPAASPSPSAPTATVPTPGRSPTPAPTSTPRPPPTGEPGGSFTEVDPADEEACQEVFGDAGAFIFDVHTHHVVPDGPWQQTAPAIADMIRGLVPDGCDEADAFHCLDRIAYINDMFLASDTTIVVLSDVPNGGDDTAPLPFADKVETAAFAERLAAGGQRRVLVQDVIAPNFGVLDERLELMSQHAASGLVASFKVYTAWGPDGRGYSLESARLGEPVVQRVLDSGVGILSGHKGLPIQGFDLNFNDPDDLVAAAAANPDLDVVVYHSAFARDTHEGPFDAAAAATGTNALLRAMDDRGVAPNTNVWCELGTAWRELMRDPTQAAHLVGKLVTRVGDRRVLWGTDAIWFGSPQAQIMGFRAFEISEEFQERYGYPALTARLKRQIFGLNAAELYGIDPATHPCVIDADALAASRVAHRDLVREGALPSPYTPRGPVTRREVLAGLRLDPRLLSPLT